MERVPLYTDVSSFQGVGMEGVPLYTEVSSFQGVRIVYRGVLQGVCSTHDIPITCVDKCIHADRG